MVQEPASLGGVNCGLLESLFTTTPMVRRHATDKNSVVVSEKSAMRAYREVLLRKDLRLSVGESANELSSDVSLTSVESYFESNNVLLFAV